MKYSSPVLLLPQLEIQHCIKLCSSFVRGRQSASTSLYSTTQKFNVPAVMSQPWIVLAVVAQLVVIAIFSQSCSTDMLALNSSLYYTILCSTFLRGKHSASTSV